MGENRNRYAGLLTVLGGFAIFSAVMPLFEYRGGTTTDIAMMKHLQAHPDDMPYTETYSFGWSFSPLVEHRKAQELSVAPDGDFSKKHSTNTHIGLLSVSSLSLVVGAVLFAMARKQPTKSEPQVS